jgi:hypothetical protein
MKIINLVIQAGIGLSMALSGVLHAYLYVHGYRDIPTVGPAFLVQASVFCAVGVLIAIGGPAWLRLVAVLGAGGSLLAFAMSRTVGLFGFSETGWEPSPYAVLTVVAEALTIVLVGVAVMRQRPRRAGINVPA